MAQGKEEFYSYEDVRRELKISEAELKKLISEGDLRAFQEGDKIKFRRDDVEKLRKERFYSFEDVLGELKVSGDELKRMISEGALRAYRHEDTVHFVKEDIDNIKRGKITEPTVILPPDELLRPENISKDETFIEEDTSSITEQLPFGDTDITIPNLEEDKIELGTEEVGLATTPLKDKESAFIEETVTDEATVAEDVSETVAEEFAETVAEKPPVMKPRPPTLIRPRRRVTVAPAELMPAVKAKVHPVFVVLLIFACLLLMFVGSFMGDISRISSGKSNFPVTITKELGKIVVDLFGIKDETGTQNIDLYKYQP